MICSTEVTSRFYTFDELYELFSFHFPSGKGKQKSLIFSIASRTIFQAFSKVGDGYEGYEEPMTPVNTRKGIQSVLLGDHKSGPRLRHNAGRAGPPSERHCAGGRL